jgi:hypothetical protein
MPKTITVYIPPTTIIMGHTGTRVPLTHTFHPQVRCYVRTNLPWSKLTCIRHCRDYLDVDAVWSLYVQTLELARMSVSCHTYYSQPNNTDM